MGFRNDLTGEKSGFLEVIEFSHNDDKGQSWWKCHCHNCGKDDVLIRGTAISGKRTKSCGCLQREKARERMKTFGKGKFKDISGEKRNHLTAIRIVGVENHGTKGDIPIWECECDCAAHNKINVRRDYFIDGVVKSCGCLRHDNAHNFEDITGNRYGHLVAQFHYTKGKIAYWHCICDCGNETDVSAYKLKHNLTKSCGASYHQIDDKVGNKYGELTVEEYVGKNKYGHTVWRCRCSCGNVVDVDVCALTSESTKTCGKHHKGHRPSDEENEVKYYVESLGYITEKAKKILGKKEIDILVRDKNIGIEYNGSRYHATLGSLYKNKDKYYHRDKFLEAKEKGIHLINIFDVDWTNNQEKIKMYLCSLFLPQESIMARKCEVKKVSNDTACEFVEKYHLQGANKATMKINYGLYYEGELYAVMSFIIINTEEGQYELHRYCVKDDYTIADGANTLLNVFEEEYSPKYIVAYSDNDYFTGNIYKLLGFEEKQQLEPNYYWYNKKEELYVENRELDDKNDDDMLKLGSCKVYRSGTTKWEKYYN